MTYKIKYNPKRGELPADWDILRDGEIIATFWDEADAQHFMATEDLLSACKQAQEVLERQGITIGDLGYAIQKAEGAK